MCCSESKSKSEYMISCYCIVLLSLNLSIGVLWNITKIWACLFSLAVDADGPVQISLFKSLKLWSFYLDLEESLGTLDSTRAVYERILDISIATPQIVLNYARLLEVWAFHQ
jgi:hypothetical protein